MTVCTVAPLAREDLDQIWDYVAQDNPAAADRLIDGFQEKFSLLAGQPFLGELYRFLRLAGVGAFRPLAGAAGRRPGVYAGSERGDSPRTSFPLTPRAPFTGLLPVAASAVSAVG